MNRSPARRSGLPVSRQALAACGCGLLMGQVVNGIAIFREGSRLGLVLALVFVLSGSVSLMLVLLHWRGGPAAVRQTSFYGWLAALGSGVLMSLHGGTLF